MKGDELGPWQSASHRDGTLHKTQRDDCIRCTIGDDRAKYRWDRKGRAHVLWPDGSTAVMKMDVGLSEWVFDDTTRHGEPNND